MKSAHLTITLLLGVVLCGCASGMPKRIRFADQTDLAQYKKCWEATRKVCNIYPTGFADGPAPSLEVLGTLPT